MKKLTKQDIAKLRWLAERGVESEACMLSSEISRLPDQLGNSFEYLPQWHYLVSVAGQMDNLAQQIAFLKHLDKKPKRK